MIQEQKPWAKRRRPTYTEEQRAAIVAEYEAWEGGLLEFCRMRGVSPGSVCAWRRRRREAGASDPEGKGWVEVSVSPSKAAAGEAVGGLWVEFRRGAVAAVRVAAGADPKWTAKIVEALQCGG